MQASGEVTTQNVYIGTWLVLIAKLYKHHINAVCEA